MDDKEQTIAIKFCTQAVSPDKKDECVETFQEAISSGFSGDSLERLQSMTGMDEDQLMKIMLKSCPLCPVSPA